MQTILVAVLCALSRPAHVQAASVLSLERGQLALEAEIAASRSGDGGSPTDVDEAGFQHSWVAGGQPPTLLLREHLMGLIQRGAQAVEEAWYGETTERERARQSNKETAAILLLLIFSVLVWITLTGASAHLYVRQKRWPEPVPGADPEQADLDFRQFETGLFDCLQDGRSCCWATWCPCIRWADNMGMVGIMGYWVGISLFCGIVMMNAFSGGVVLWCAASLLWMSYRQQLRRKFAMDHGSLSTYLMDSVLYCCCCCCAIAQEARHIEAAGQAGHRALSKPQDYDDPMEILSVKEKP